MRIIFRLFNKLNSIYIRLCELIIIRILIRCLFDLGVYLFLFLFERFSFFFKRGKLYGCFFFLRRADLLFKFFTLLKICVFFFKQ